MSSIHRKIIDLKKELLSHTLKKSGHNKHGGFDYYELGDFLPSVITLLAQYGLNDVIEVDKEIATLTLYDTDSDQSVKFTFPFYDYETPLSKSGSKLMQDIQYTGAINTYVKRYLYLNAFGIIEGEVVDSLDNEKMEANKSKDELISYIRSKGLDLKTIASTYGITKTTSTEDIKDILNKLKDKYGGIE